MKSILVNTLALLLILLEKKRHNAFKIKLSELMYLTIASMVLVKLKEGISEKWRVMEIAFLEHYQDIC